MPAKSLARVAGARSDPNCVQASSTIPTTGIARRANAEPVLPKPRLNPPAYPFHPWPFLASFPSSPVHHFRD
jgi:hypothetical protein